MFFKRKKYFVVHSSNAEGARCTTGVEANGEAAGPVRRQVWGSGRENVGNSFHVVSLRRKGDMERQGKSWLI